MNQFEPTTAPTGMRRTGVIAGVSAGLLGGAAAGLLFAMPGATSAADDGVDEVAAVAQVDDTGDADTTVTDAPPTDEERLARRTERIRTSLDDLVADGTLDEGQADAVAAHLAEQAPDRGPRGPHGGHRGPGHLAEGVVLELLDIEADALRDALRDGATLAEVAEINGVSTEDLIDALVAEATERLDQAVADGRLTEDEAAEKAAELEARITERVNSARGDRGPAADSDATDGDG